MTLKVVDKSPAKTVKAREIKVGQVFYGKIRQSDREHRLLLRIYFGMVNLKYPEDIWTNMTEEYFEIFEYRPVKATLIVDEYE